MIRSNPETPDAIRLSEEDERLVRLLLRTYTELKRRYEGHSYRNLLSRSSVHMQFFHRAALKIRGLLSRGYPISPARFIWCVFSYFGKNTYPAHFASEKVWQMYFAWEQTRAGNVVRGVSFDTEEDTLQHICMSRNQTLPELWPSLKESGLFSDAFVEHMNGIISSI